MGDIEENATPTNTDVCKSFSSFFIPASFFPASFANNSDVFTIGFPAPPPPPSPSDVGKKGVLYSLDSGEVVGTVDQGVVKAIITVGTESDEEEGSHVSPSAKPRVRKGSMLKTPGCILTLATLMVGSVTFLASLFIFYPRRGATSPQDVSIYYTNGANETNVTQIETVVEDSSSAVMMRTISPSPTLSPTSTSLEIIETGSHTVSPSLSPSFLPTVSPKRKTESIALRAVEDTFILHGTTNKQGKGNQQTYGKSDILRIKGGDEAEIITIIRFDTTPLLELKATVASSKISLFAITESVFGGQINLVTDDCDWNENDISWTNAPDCILGGAGDTAELIDGWMRPDLLGWYDEVARNEWNEANLDWQPTQIPSQLTLLVTSDNEDGVTYSSGNNKNGPGGPMLIVEYYTET